MSSEPKPHERVGNNGIMSISVGEQGNKTKRVREQGEGLEVYICDTEICEIPHEYHVNFANTLLLAAKNNCLNLGHEDYLTHSTETQNIAGFSFLDSPLMPKCFPPCALVRNSIHVPYQILAILSMGMLCVFMQEFLRYSCTCEIGSR